MLKKKSDERVSSWPNTLAAGRKAKLDWKKAREDERENERRKIDQHEAELQRKTRVDAIKRANQLMYEQTDKMKFLRGQQLYTDVIATREDQISALSKKRSALEKEEKKWHEEMLVRLKESERREIEETERRKAKSKDISEIQQKQLKDAKNQLVAKLKAAYVEGQLMKQMVEQDIVDEQRLHHTRMEESRQRNEEMKNANMNLKELRKELLKVEEVEAEKRRKQVEQMETIVKARTELEKKHFEQRQAMRRKIIEKATKDLEARQVQEQNILEKQHKESEKKHHEEMEKRRIRKAKQDAAIDRSRQMQIQLRSERSRTEKAAAQLLAEHWKDRNASIEEEEQKERMDRYNKNLEIRASQEAQIQENKIRRAEQRANDLLRDEQTKAVMMEDDERFKNFAQMEIDRFKAKGKKTFLLERARDAKDIQLLAGKHK